MNTFLSLARMEEEVKTYVLREEVSHRIYAGWPD